MTNSNFFSKFSFSAMLCIYIKSDVNQVREAIDSAFYSQTYTPNQLIVVFDGPVHKEVRELILGYSNSINLKQISFGENLGHGPARAAAVEACNDDWLAIIDDDDISLPNRFELLLKEIQENPNCAVVGGSMIEFDDCNNKRTLMNKIIYPTLPSDIKHYMKTRSPVAQPTALLRVSAIKDVGNYQPWYNNEDYFLWIRLVAAGYDIRNIPDTVLLFRVNLNLYSRRGGIRYWWNEVRLQLYSLNKGTTTLSRFLIGSIVRFIVQVLMTPSLRAIFYKKLLRK